MDIIPQLDCIMSSLIDMRHSADRLAEEMQEANRPSRRADVCLWFEHARWWAIYGGLKTMGNTPEEACLAFDRAWYGK